MEIKLGKVLTAHLLTSDVLHWRPNKITKSSERYHYQFGLPVDWERYEVSDFKKLRQTVEMEFAQEDLDAWDDLLKMQGFKVGAVVDATGDGAKPIGDGEVAVKTEPTEKSASMQMAAKIVSLEANVKTNLSRYNDMKLTTTIMKCKAEQVEDVQMLAALFENLTAAAAKLSKFCNLMEKLLTHDYDKTALPKLIVLMEQMDTRHASNVSWADKLGIGDGASKKRRKK